MELDTDMYDIGEDGIPQKVSHQEYVDRKREKIKEEIKKHRLYIHMLEKELESTTTIQLA